MSSKKLHSDIKYHIWCSHSLNYHTSRISLASYTMTILIYFLHHGPLMSSTGNALHCQEENHVRDKKKIYTFSKLHHKNGEMFYQYFLMSRYTQYILHTKNS